LPTGVLTADTMTASFMESAPTVWYLRP
jgi:hypothetical protein